MAQNAADPRKWAEDVLVVYDCIRMARIPEDLETPARSELLEWVQESNNNKREFFKNFLPKASDILAKLTKPDDDVEIQRLERKSIAELKEYLKNYISENQSCPQL